MDKIIFELLTPPACWPQDKVTEWILHVREIPRRNHITYLNLPEVINEHRDGDRCRPIFRENG